MWLQKLFELCCCGDEDWVVSQYADINDRNGPLAEECCDTSCDADLIEQYGQRSPARPMRVEAAIPIAATVVESTPVEAVSPAFAVHTTTNFTLGDFSVVTNAPVSITYGDLAVDVAPEDIVSVMTVSEQAAQADTPVQAPADSPEKDEEKVAQVSALPESGFARRVDIVKVDQHRRVTESSKLVAAIVAEVKAKLGMPIKNAANDLTIRFLAASRCKDLGVRPLHAREVVELVIVLVYAPDAADVRAAVMQGSKTVRDAHAAHDYAQRSTVYKTFVPRCVHSLFHSSPKRGAAVP